MHPFFAFSTHHCCCERFIVYCMAWRTRSTSACLHDMGCKLAVPADRELTWTYTYVLHDRAPYAELEQ